MLETKIVEKQSKKGNTYYALEIQLTDTYKKIVFLDRAEYELIKLINE